MGKIEDAFISAFWNDDVSAFLKETFEKQAIQKYVEGDYTLKNLDKQGQRINIVIEVARPGKSPVTFVSGWMVRKDGTITNNTPLGG